ncbi:MAG: hypothetical protein ABEL51_13295 [Salinibacter sp.]
MHRRSREALTPILLSADVKIQTVNMQAFKMGGRKRRWGIVMLIVGLFGLFGSTLSTHPAYGQESERNPASASDQAQWTVGIQAFPVPGVSVRRALTPRLAVQVARIPGFGDRVPGFDGGVGGRLLYRSKAQNLFGGFPKTGSDNRKAPVSVL